MMMNQQPVLQQQSSQQQRMPVRRPTRTSSSSMMSMSGLMEDNHHDQAQVLAALTTAMKAFPREARIQVSCLKVLRHILLQTTQAAKQEQQQEQQQQQQQQRKQQQQQVSDNSDDEEEEEEEEIHLLEESPHDGEETTLSSGSSSGEYKQQDDDDDDDDDNCQMDSMRVGICGAGAIGLAMSALLSRAGHDPMMWSPSLSSLQTQQGMEDDPTTKWTASGAFDDDDDDHDSSSTTSFSCRVAATLHDLVRDNEIIVVALPANGHKVVLDRLVPLLRPGRHAVLISSQASLGALYLSTELQHYFQSQQPQQDNNDNDDDESKSIPIAAWATTVCTARQTSPTAVHIHTIRKRVDYCILPRRTTNDDDWSRIQQQQQQQQQMQALQSQLFPQVDHFRARSNLFAISLANLNPQNHLAIALGNMSRMEKGETWYQLQHVTPKLGQFLEALDRERLDIAQALLDPDDYSQLKTLRQHFQQGFLGQQSFDEEEDDGGDDNGSISDLMQQIYEHGKDVHGPNTADTRYVTEDVPFGLALTVALGNLVQRPATLHKAGMQIMSAMYERDFASENDLLASLGLLDSSSSCRLEELREGVMETGYLGRPAVAVLEEEEGCEDMAHDAAMMASTMMTMTSETIF